MRRFLPLLLALAGFGPGRADPPPIAAGPFEPSWRSLTNYQCPDWFRDAKFGIWAHWSVQTQPEQGDWYAHRMYVQGSAVYEHHVRTYGHPSRFGFKDIIPLWKAERFDPDRLLAFYRASGARYFMALAAHCDNFDNFNSTHQPWNSVKLGPRRDLIRDWSAAARKHDLRFGVSVHNGGWTWRWFEPAQGSDTNGPLAGVPYDGRLTRADGRGLWWDGLDPQDLYAQNHPVGERVMDRAYCDKFFRRVQQLWDDYQPDLIYFDEAVVPLRPTGEAYGLSLYAHCYNSSLRRHGTNQAVVTAKILNEEQRRAITYDIERGRAAGILPQPWQTDTCLGDWHYSRDIFRRHAYKTAREVVPMLADIVSRNGNLMLSVPLRADGTHDDDEIRILNDIGAWLRVNGEAIYGSRPWKVFGEGPSTQSEEKGPFDGVKDVGGTPHTAADIRFTTRDTTLYAIVLGWPEDRRVTIRSLAGAAPDIRSVSLLGSDETLTWTRDATGLHVTLPSQRPCEFAWTLRLAP